MRILEEKTESPVTDNKDAQVYSQRIATMSQEQRIATLESRVAALELQLNELSSKIGTSECIRH